MFYIVYKNGRMWWESLLSTDLIDYVLRNAPLEALKKFVDGDTETWQQTYGKIDFAKRPSREEFLDQVHTNLEQYGILANRSWLEDTVAEDLVDWLDSYTDDEGDTYSFSKSYEPLGRRNN